MATARRITTAFATFIWLLLAAGPALAGMTGPCSATATATSTGSIDVALTDVWHIRSSDQLSASGIAAVPQTSGSGAASAFGFEIPLVGGESDGETSIDVELPDASFLGVLGRVFVLSGESSGPGGACSAALTVVLDDVNPFTTVLGAGALAMSGASVLVLIRAVRRPDRRAVSGSLGVGLLGGGLGLLLQQTSTPGGAGASLASGWAGGVISPSDVPLTVVALATSAGLAGLVAIFVPFPSELFNRTLEANRSRIVAAVSRAPLIGRFVRPAGGIADAPPSRGSGLGSLVTASAVVLCGGLLYGLLDPAFGLDARSLVTYVGILGGMMVVIWAVDAPLRAVHRRVDGDGGRLRATPWTLAIAATCVAISRLAAFEPGYLYGLLIAFEFRSRLGTADAGRAAATGAAWLTGLGLMAWFGLGSVRTAGIEPSAVTAVLETTFAAVMVAALEGAVIGLIPMRFLPGSALFSWSRLRWAVAYVPALFVFWWVLVNPAGVIDGASPAPVATAIALFVAFGAGSILFWAYFRFRPAAPVVAAS